MTVADLIDKTQTWALRSVILGAVVIIGALLWFVWALALTAGPPPRMEREWIMVLTIGITLFAVGATALFVSALAEYRS